MHLTRVQRDRATHILPLLTRLTSFSPEDRADVLGGLVGLPAGVIAAVTELLELEHEHLGYARRLLSTGFTSTSVHPSRPFSAWGRRGPEVAEGGNHC